MIMWININALRNLCITESSTFPFFGVHQTINIKYSTVSKYQVAMLTTSNIVFCILQVCKRPINIALDFCLFRLKNIFSYYLFILYNSKSIINLQNADTDSSQHIITFSSKNSIQERMCFVTDEHGSIL